jgi:hypothetical protein
MKYIKYAFLTSFALFFAVAPLFADPVDLQEVRRAGEAFKENAIKSLPISAASGLMWSDAYIGQLISKTPHFGYGIATALTSVQTDGFQAILDKTGSVRKLGADNSMMPVAVIETRLGGAFFPFDIGFKFGLLNDFESENIITDGFNRSLFLMGGEIRFSILKDGKRRLGISLGIGYNYMEGSMKSATEPGGSFSYVVNGNTEVLNATGPGEIKLFWEMKSIEAKLQVAKKILIFTPYLGTAATFYWASAGYKLNAKWDDPVSPTQISDITVSENGFSSVMSSNKTDVSVRAFGGVGISIFIIRFDISGMYDFFAKTYGCNVGFRLQV